MRIATTLLLALLVTTVAGTDSAAQQPAERIAVDVCYNFWPVEDYDLRCDVYVVDPGVAAYAVGSGFDPALSPDGRRSPSSAAPPARISSPPTSRW